jgi:hypothetical protein
LKFQSGFSKESFRLKFLATQYKVSNTLLLEFTEIGLRNNFYNSQSD